MSAEACCTCASLLSSATDSEKPLTASRRVSCCGRAICTKCIASNPRFSTYCPYCQVSSTPSSIPQGLRDPPAYSPPASPPTPHFDTPPASDTDSEVPPPAYSAYSSTGTQAFDLPKDAKSPVPTPDVLHFLHPDDTISSIALRYRVPLQILRTHNSLFSDSLLQARRTILIPGAYYHGPSLSARPVEGEEEEARKGKVRRFMVTCKVAEYDIALLYLKQTDYDLDEAVMRFQEDEQWEKEHPLDGSSTGAAGRAGVKFGEPARRVGIRRF
ncbi:hypothetical protein EV356DRAFT_522092 [Viridothelium virens]|uniref:LysM domain-containing protein n=1 Tax=Viridothelium virens TaxID=1048519 RepID=A0A6A6GSF7_VIRVR|nr:hypothetical protein EV356DRAFT_522092 [Viridothelium virens]